MRKRYFTVIIAIVMAFCSLFSFACNGEGGNIGSNVDGKKYVSGKTAKVDKYVFRNFDEDVMPVSGYLGPNFSYSVDGYDLPSIVTDETYKKLSDCGINLIIEQAIDMSTNLEGAKLALSLAEKYGISYFMTDKGSLDYDGNTTGEFSLDAIKSSLTIGLEYKSFAGLYLRDEPSKNTFDKLKNAIDVFNQAKTELNEEQLSMYYNLLPSCLQMSGTGESISWANDYVPSFAKLGPDYLMFDMYPVSGPNDEVASSWFYYIGKMNQIAKEHGKMWMGYAQAGGALPAFSEDARVVTEGELNWDVNTMLAFGAKGISYYTLVCPPYWTFTQEAYANDEAHSLINKWGNKTAMYYYAQKINKQIAAMDHVLMNAEHQGVIIHGNSPCSYSESDLLTNYGALKSVSGSAALIGCFDYKDGMALLVVNNSITEKRAEITLEFDNLYKSTVIQRGISTEVGLKEMTLHLEAGECALVVL